MPWPWQCVHKGCLGLCFLPMGTTLALAAGLSHGHHAHICCLDLGCLVLLWLLPHDGCHGLGNIQVGMPWTWQHVHGAYLSLGYLPSRGLFSQIRFFSPLLLKGGYFPKGVIWSGQHAMELAVCPIGLPWPLLLAYGGCLGLGCIP